MPVSSYVLRCRPQDQEHVLSQLKILGDFAIGAQSDEGVAVAVDSMDYGAAEDMTGLLEEISGVRGVILVYFNEQELSATRQLVGMA